MTPIPGWVETGWDGALEVGLQKHSTSEKKKKKKKNLLLGVYLYKYKR